MEIKLIKNMLTNISAGDILKKRYIESRYIRRREE